MHLGGHRRAYAPAENKLQVLANRGAENLIKTKHVVLAKASSQQVVRRPSLKHVMWIILHM